MIGKRKQEIEVYRCVKVEALFKRLKVVGNIKIYQNIYILKFNFKNLNKNTFLKFSKKKNHQIRN